MLTTVSSREGTMAADACDACCRPTTELKHVDDLDWLCSRCVCASCERPLRKFGLTIRKDGAVELCTCTRTVAPSTNVSPEKDALVQMVEPAVIQHIEEHHHHQAPAVPDVDRSQDSDIMRRLDDIYDISERSYQLVETAVSRPPSANGSFFVSPPSPPAKAEDPNDAAIAKLIELSQRLLEQERAAPAPVVVDRVDRAEVDAVQSELNRAKNDLQRVESELQHVRATSSSQEAALRAELLSYQEQAQQLSLQLAREQQRQKDQETSLSLSQEGHAAQLTRLREAHEAEVADLTRRLDQMGQRVDTLTNQLTQQQEATTEQSSSLQQQLSVVQRELADTKTALYEEQQARKRDAHERHERQELEAEKARLQAEQQLVVALQAAEQAETALASVQADVLATQAEADRLRQQAEDESVRKAAFEAELLAAQEELARARQAEAEEQVRIAAAEARVRETEANALQLQSDMEVVQAQLAAAQVEIERGRQAALDRQQHEELAALAMAAKEAEELAKLQAEEERRKALEETERLAAKARDMEEQMAREEHERKLKQQQEEAARREREAQEAVRKKTQMSRNLKNKALRQANQQIKLTRSRARLKKGGSATGSFGFEIEGGDDVDGLQPHVSSVEEYSAAANGGLQVGDFILGINGQDMTHKNWSQIMSTIKQCGLRGHLDLKLHRDYSGEVLASLSEMTDVVAPKRRPAKAKPSTPAQKLSAGPRRKFASAAKAIIASRRLSTDLLSPPSPHAKPQSRSHTPRSTPSAVSSARSTPMASPRMRRANPSTPGQSPRVVRRAAAVGTVRPAPKAADHRASLRHIQPGTSVMSFDSGDVANSANSASPEVLVNLTEDREGIQTPTNSRGSTPNHEHVVRSPPASWGSETPSESDSGARSLVNVDEMNPRVPQKGTLRAMSLQRKKSLKKL
eukprot:m.119766 g.119766  ORF g.119766 m.119766 type:complete len:922 (-) comp15599_c0_seq6:70-2835(-)